jgi:hypothetical protein
MMATRPSFFCGRQNITMEWLATAFAFLFLWSTVLGTDYTAGQDDGFVAFVVRKKIHGA